MGELVVLLSLGTIGFVAAFAYISARTMEKRLEEDHPKSSLSRDGIAERMAAGTYDRQ